ncbi:MAG TPA: hypothetical protein VI072_04040 [Polyangiaceae bacterium]
MELPGLPLVRELVIRYARVIEQFGGEIGRRPLVLPNSAFFPDEFRGDDASLQRLVSRMAEHAGMADIPIRATLDGEEGACGTGAGACGSGACGTTSVGDDGVALVDTGDGWVLRLAGTELANPVTMTARLARALAEIFLYETREEDTALDEPFPVTIDLAGVALGYGVLLMEGSYVYSKSCGGPRVGQVTTLSCGELAVPYALFVKASGVTRRAALKELGVTQREVVTQALDVLDANDGLIAALGRAPERVAAGLFELGEAKPGLLRLFGGKRKETDEDGLPSLEDLERLAKGSAAPKPRPVDPKRDELRALVDEAFESARPASD